MPKSSLNDKLKILFPELDFQGFCFAEAAMGEQAFLSEFKPFLHRKDAIFYGVRKPGEPEFGTPRADKKPVERISLAYLQALAKDLEVKEEIEKEASVPVPLQPEEKKAAAAQPVQAVDPFIKIRIEFEKVLNSVDPSLTLTDEEYAALTTPEENDALISLLSDANELPIQELKAQIDYAEKIRIGLTQKISAESDKEKERIKNSKDHTLNEKNELLKKIGEVNRKKIEDALKKYPFLAELHDIDIYLRGLALYQRSNKFSHVFKRVIPRNSSTMVNTLLTPAALDSQDAKQPGGIKELITTYQPHTSKTLQACLDALTAAFKDRIAMDADEKKVESVKSPFTLTLSSGAHKIALGYPHNGKNYILINANDSVPRKIKAENIGRKALAAAVSIIDQYWVFGSKTILKLGYLPEKNEFILIEAVASSNAGGTADNEKKIRALLKSKKLRLLDDMKQHLAITMSVAARAENEMAPIALAWKKSAEFLAAEERAKEQFQSCDDIDNQSLLISYFQAPRGVPVFIKDWIRSGAASGFTIQAVKDGDSFELLQYACYAGNQELAQFLLESKANPNSGNPRPLVLAVCNGNLAMVELLLSHKADINDNFLRTTALGAAARLGNVEMTAFLLARGANPNGRSDYFTPLYYAAAEGHIDVVRQLIKAGAKLEENVVVIAAKNRHREVVRELILVGAPGSQSVGSLPDLYFYKEILKEFDKNRFEHYALAVTGGKKKELFQDLQAMPDDRLLDFFRENKTSKLDYLKDTSYYVVGLYNRDSIIDGDYELSKTKNWQSFWEDLRAANPHPSCKRKIDVLQEKIYFSYRAVLIAQYEEALQRSNPYRIPLNEEYDYLRNWEKESKAILSYRLHPSAHEVRCKWLQYQLKHVPFVCQLDSKEKLALQNIQQPHTENEFFYFPNLLQKSLPEKKAGGQVTQNRFFPASTKNTFAAGIENIKEQFNVFFQYEDKKPEQKEDRKLPDNRLKMLHQLVAKTHELQLTGAHQAMVDFYSFTAAGICSSKRALSDAVIELNYVVLQQLPKEQKPALKALIAEAEKVLQQPTPAPIKSLTVRKG